MLGQLAPVLILPLFYRIEKLDAPELTDRIARLAAGHRPVDRGRLSHGPERGDGQGQRHAGRPGPHPPRAAGRYAAWTASCPRRSKSIFAHEIGHHVFRHIRKMILAGLIYSAAGFWVCDRLLAAWVARDGGECDYAQLPVGTLPLLLLILTLFAHVAGAAAKRRQPAFRAAERPLRPGADRLKDAYLSAFRKLARLNKDDPNPHWLDVLLVPQPPAGGRAAGDGGAIHGRPAASRPAPSAVNQVGPACRAGPGD